MVVHKPFLTVCKVDNINGGITLLVLTLSGAMDLINDRGQWR